MPAGSHTKSAQSSAPAKARAAHWSGASSLDVFDNLQGPKRIQSCVVYSYGMSSLFQAAQPTISRVQTAQVGITQEWHDPLRES